MTSNQIAYAGVLETQRADRAREAETYRSNVANLNEVMKHNRAVEEYNRRMLEESRRSNLAREQENFRHNTRTEDLTKLQQEEVARSNRANEYLKQYSADLTAQTSRANAETAARASKYASDNAASSSRYASDSSASASRYSSNMNYRSGVHRDVTSMKNTKTQGMFNTWNAAWSDAVKVFGSALPLFMG